MNETLTISDIQEGLAEKKFSSVELTKSYLERIKKDTLNAFITINDNAIHAAKEADDLRAKGEGTSLTGVPYAVKDVLTTEGLRTTAASKILANYIPPYTATAVERLHEQGMVILGKTNCDEFAMGSSNENSAYGPVKNPFDTDRVPGGSSGGSAVAVAADLTPVSLGTDTGGSVRQPSSLCGVIGLKPTYGRISRYGLIALASSFDQVGIFSRTAYDAAVLLREMAGHDSNDATSSSHEVDDYVAELNAPKDRITIGLPKEYFSDHADADVSAVMQKTINDLKTVPEITFKDVSLPHTKYALAVYYIIMPSEASANLARFDGLRYGVSTEKGKTLEEQYAYNRSEGFGPETRRRIMLGTYTLSAGYYDAYYVKATKVRSLIRRDFDDVFKEVDMILTPTTPTPAFKIGEKSSDPLTMYLSDIYTVSANIAGIPACSFPVGTVRGLPVGMQVMGPSWSESRLLSFLHQHVHN